ncbi:uncharacterized protein N0V89_009605 [Didymosphaeria variabile]|uniref:Peptidase metallopeptidase domain-containing protein n=1 Tax=Didymosphaeria variabile TaxID=1932322 RepID=A0A9W8XFX1_9PLEO|nr:uncharacterized protein N0V89_009605 [Didymosphaeria variabile]KAJ4348233.1 hypothetical protein N0V89_009605 [Didymosphaeria variabile]
MQVRLLLLVYVALATLAAACPSLLNHSAPQIVDHPHLNRMLGRRWTEFVTDLQSCVTRWPRGQDRYTRIYYCYATVEHKNQLKDLISAALALWANALGPAGANSQHSLLVVEHPLHFCYTRRNPNDQNSPFVWNQNIPEETLLIQVDASTGSATSHPGFSNGRQETHFGLPTAGRHFMKVNPNLINMFRNNPHRGMETARASIAHEFGHVFGLEHEHAREDRDRYVFFDCTGLEGYPEAKARLQAEQQAGRTQDKMSQVCYFPDVAKKYGFGRIENYSKPNTFRIRGGVSFELRRRHGFEYDVHSIMHYGSSMGARYWNPNDLANAKVPLRRWRNGGPNFQPPKQATNQNSELIRTNERPSNLDVEILRILYPS